MLVVGAAAVTAPPATAAGDWLTPSERAWLTRHPVVRVSADPDFAPYSYVDRQGQATGIATAYLDRIGPMLGLRFVPVHLPNWAAVVAAARAHEVDMISALVRNDEREGWLAFTEAYVATPLVVITRHEQLRLRSVDALLGQRVALVKGYAASRRVVERLPGLEVAWADSALAGLAAVAAGEVDAYVGVLGVSLHLMRLHGLTNLKPNIGFELLSHGQRMAVRKDWAPLATIIDKALARIGEADKLAIQSRWMPLSGTAAVLAGPQWTAGQRAWLAEAPRLRVGLPSNMAPFASARPGREPAGLAVDLLTALAARAGLAFDVTASSSPAELAAMLRERRIDVLLTSEGAEAGMLDALPTEVFYDSSYLLLCQSQVDCVTRFDAGQPMRVAVQAGSAADRHVLRLPQLRRVGMPALEQAVDALAEGKVEAVLGEARLLLRAVEAAGSDRALVEVGGPPVDASMQLRMLVRADWPELGSVLDVALHSLGDAGLSELRARWAGPPPDRADVLARRQLQRVLRMAALAGLVVLLGLGWLWWANRRLRAEVHRRSEAERQLEAARTRAEAASLHKSEFVANTSHELRTPLHAIIGTQHMLEDSALDDRQRRLLDIQRTATGSLLDLVNDLLDLARMETGTLPLRARPFGLRGLVDDCLTMVRDAARRKGLVLSVEAGAGLPGTVVGDGHRLQQVLVNLLSNAVHYTSAGSVTLQVHARNGTPGQSARLDFAVVDSGPGIAPEQQARVFEPYCRGSAAQAGRTEGAGLGLSIARHLVAQMGGTLALDSAPGRGSRFHFGIELPLAPNPLPENRDVPVDAAAERPPSNGMRVLLVEDNEVNRLIAGELLAQRGCVVSMAVDGASALASLAHGAVPEIVLLDVGLPDIDGLEVARRIRAFAGPRARVPIIGLTARALLHERQECLDAGMDDVVHKPFEPAELWRHIVALVSRASSNAEDRTPPAASR